MDPTEWQTAGAGHALLRRPTLRSNLAGQLEADLTVGCGEAVATSHLQVAGYPKDDRRAG